MEINITSYNQNDNKEIYKTLALINSFIHESFSSEKNFETIILKFHVETSINQFNEIEYTLDESIPFIATIKGKNFNFNMAEIPDVLFDRFDDDILAQLNSGNQSQGNSLEILEEKIANTFPIESLYYRIKNKEEKGITYECQIELLYQIVTRKEMVKDIEIVKDFLTHFYEAKYASVLTYYMSLPEFFYQTALKDSEVSSSVKNVIVSRKGQLPELSELLRTNNFSEIEDYYFKMWENVNVENKGEHAVAIFNKGFTTVDMIRDFLIRFDVSFTLNLILSQKKCPEDIMLKYMDIESYQDVIVANQNTTSFILTKLYNVSLMRNYHHIVSKIYNHPNLDQLTKKNIEKRNLFLELKTDINSQIKSLSSDLSNIEPMLINKVNQIVSLILDNYKNQKVRLFNNEIGDVIDLIKKNGLIKYLDHNNFLELKQCYESFEEFNSELQKTRMGILTDEEFTNILTLDDPIYANVIRSIKSIQQLEKIVETELTKTLTFNTKNFKLRAVKDNENFDCESSTVIRQYKKDLINYANKLALDCQYDELSHLLAQLNANKGSVLEDTVCLNKVEIKEIVKIADQTNDSQVMNNVINLRKMV